MFPEKDRKYLQTAREYKNFWKKIKKLLTFF